jgi:hypothetical protein
MRRYILMLVAGLGMNFAACTSLQTQQASEVQRSAYPPATYSNRVGTTQVLLYWNCARPEPGVLRLDGVVHSAYASEVRYPEFDLVGLDANDRVVSEATSATRDSILRTNQVSPFQIDLRTAGSEIRFDLYYQYQSLGSLRSQLPGGTPVERVRFMAPAGVRFMVRDVCSETQHRIPKPSR